MTGGWEPLVLAVVAAWAAGYGMGRRRGRIHGFAEGMGYAPLELKRAAWIRGRCPVCGAGTGSQEEQESVLGGEAGPGGAARTADGSEGPAAGREERAGGGPAAAELPGGSIDALLTFENKS